MWKNFKELRKWWSFFYFIYNCGTESKLNWVSQVKIEPLARKHPILNFIASII